MGVVRPLFNVEDVPGGSTWIKATILRPLFLYPLARDSTGRAVERVALVIMFGTLCLPQLLPVADPWRCIVALRAFRKFLLGLSWSDWPASYLRPACAGFDFRHRDGAHTSSRLEVRALNECPSRLQHLKVMTDR